MAEALADDGLVAGRLDHQKLNDDWSPHREYLQQNGVVTSRGYLPTAAGCSLGVRRSVMEAVGGFDGENFRYAEDIDFCWKAQLNGVRLRFVPDAVVHYQHRPTLRGRFLQAFRWASDESALYRRYGPLGMRKPGPGGGDLARFGRRLLRIRSWSDLAGSTASVGKQLGRLVGEMRRS